MSLLLKSMLERALLTRFEVLDLLKVSKSKLHSDIAAQLFPAPIKVGTRSYFLVEEVQAWLDQRVAERDAKTAQKAARKPAA